ncbi:MAG TPA: universal stress protein [Bacteroidales bacterium]|nr:universal stress protein [Bacteroidales bacterium]
MYHIIVPIDFSKEALKGLELAILFSNKIGCEIRMVYVRKKSNDYNPGTREEEFRFAEKQFKQIQENYQPHLPPGINLKYIIRTGRIYREIVSQANAYNDSFIVTSTHGASGFEKFFIGSNAFKIISATNKPVITIRGNKIPKKIKRIVLPLDITADTRQKVPFTVELAKWFNAEIHVVTLTSLQTDDVVKKLSAYSNQVCEYIESKGIKVEKYSLIGSNLTDIVIDYAQKVKADLISIMTEQSQDLSNFVMGSYAQQMLNKSDIPVMSTNPKELHISEAFRTQG